MIKFLFGNQYPSASSDLFKALIIHSTISKDMRQGQNSKSARVVVSSKKAGTMDVSFIFYQYLFEDSFSFRQLLVATWDVLRLPYGVSVFFVHLEFYKALYKQLKGSKGIIGGLPKIAHVGEPNSSNFQEKKHATGTTAHMQKQLNHRKSPNCTFACLKTFGLCNCANSQQLDVRQGWNYNQLELVFHQKWLI
nr:hypothetical protein CFP56_14170 [Quercus suber]